MPICARPKDQGRALTFFSICHRDGKKISIEFFLDILFIYYSTTRYYNYSPHSAFTIKYKTQTNKKSLSFSTGSNFFVVYSAFFHNKFVTLFFRCELFSYDETSKLSSYLTVPRKNLHPILCNFCCNFVITVEN